MEDLPPTVAAVSSVGTTGRRHIGREAQPELGQRREPPRSMPGEDHKV